MKALLWKEARENAYKVATALGAVLFLFVLRQLEYFNKGFIADADAWGGIIGAVTAAVLAVEVLASERSRGTLEFLLVRPTTVGRILAAKFLVGAVALFAVIAAFWAMVYAVPPGPVSPWRTDVLQLLHDVPWLAMVYAWYLPMLALYSVVFAASAATDNTGEAAGVAGIIGLALVLFLGLSVSLIPGFRERFPAPFDFLEFIGNDDHRLLGALDPSTIARRTMIALCFVGTGLAAAHTVLSRARQVAIGRKPLVIAAFVLVALMLTLPQLRPERTAPIHPTHAVQLAEARDITIDGGRLYAFQKEQLVVFEVAANGVLNETGRVALEGGGSLRQMQVVGDRVCGLVHRGTQGQDQSLACFDVSDPDNPETAGTMAVEGGGTMPFDELTFNYRSRRPGPVVHTVGDIIVVGNVEDTRSSLTSIAVTNGPPTVLDSLVLERFEYAERSQQDGYTLSREDRLQRHTVSLAPGDRHVFVGWHKGLRVVEVGVDGTMRSVADLDTGDRVTYTEPDHRSVHRRGSTLFVDRVWPEQLLEVDISEPTGPRIVATHRSRIRTASDIVDDYYVHRGGRGVALYPVDDPYPFRTPTLTLPIESDDWWTRDVEFYDGRAYALMDDQLAVFDMPGRDEP